MRPRLPACALAVLGWFAADALAQPRALPPSFTQRDKGNCTACHQLPEGMAPVVRNDMGPRLDGARMRELGRARLREMLADPLAANPDTAMPPFGRHRILEAGEIDAIVEFLHALP